MFLAPWFVLAGLAAALGPLVIHLMNRRRFRVVPWAAMEFLRQAIRRSRRILQLRDLLLLAVRTLCVLLFAFAMARPFLRAGATRIGPDQPLHAVLVIDNSLSMSYVPLDKSLLEQAKARASQLIDRLPRGSRISVLPLCGAERGFNLGAYSTKGEAKEALAAIAPVDRRGSVSAAIDLAKEACRRVTDPAAKQVVFFSDGQAIDWPAQGIDTQLKDLACPLDVVAVPPGEAENAWVADFHLQDAIADPATPAEFLATVRYQGAATRLHVPVTLTVDGVPVATQTVDLQPSQAREVRFPPYQFEVTTEPGRPTFAAAEVSIPHDRLAGDDVRTLVVPVVAALPVVFVDEYGANEDPQKNRYGETYRLRRLLAPVTSGEERARQLIQVRHVRMEELDRGLLADARLVVIAGVPDPQSAGPLLHEYVAQGGGLVIAAGGDFDPARWTDGAWDGGLGVLPAPLRPEPVGGLPVASSAGPQPFQLDFSSMVHDYFLLEQTPRDELQDLFRLPYFFKAVDADLSEPVLAEARRRLAGKIEQDRKRLVEVSRRLAELTRLEARGQLGQAEQQERARLEAEMQQIRPDWLLWSDPREAPAEQALPAAELAGQWMPRVLARYSNRVPFLIERKIGCGDVLLVTTGVFRGWNTLTQTNTVLIFDRIFRDMLQRTLPERNPSTVEPVVLPVTAEQRRARFTLTWPGGGKEALAVGALGADRYGLTVGPLPLRGEYRLTAYGSAEPAEAGQAAKLWEVPLAVNGPAVESELAALDSAGLETRMGKAEYRLIGQGQSIALAGAGARDQEFWRWLMTAALAGLLVELGLLVWPWRAGEQTP